jgi:hypothetical protein
MGQADDSPRAVSLRRSVGIAVVALAVVLWAGYGRHWPWTCLNARSATLRDWLQVVFEG